MNRNLGLSLITLVMILSLVELKQDSADPLWGFPPPPPNTPTPMSQSSDLLLYQEDLYASPLPTETPKSQAEQQAIEQLQQSQVLGNEQDRAMPTRAGQPPKNEMASYKDPNFGFSFTYPSNWQVDAPGKTAHTRLPAYGYIVTIFNFNNVVVKRDSNSDEIKIDVWLFPKPENYNTLEAWAASRTSFGLDVIYSEFERFFVGEEQFITWTATGPTVPQGTRLYALERPTSIFNVVAYPSTSLYISSVDELVKSLK